MAHKLQIAEKDKLNLNFNVRYEKMDRVAKPTVKAEVNGKPVSLRTTYQGKVLGPGMTKREWVDKDGNVYSKQEITFTYDGQEVDEISQTKIFEIEGFQDLSNYTDNYVISKYYELFPDTNGMTKDHDKEVAIKSNLYQMRKLWEYLIENKVVARGEFNPSSRGFVASDGYIRAIKINGSKWGLEIGIFHQEKIFTHLNEGVPAKMNLSKAQAKKKIKMV